MSAGIREEEMRTEALHKESVAPPLPHIRDHQSMSSKSQD